MNGLMLRLQAWLGPRAAVLKSLGVPAFVILVLAMMVLPLPAFALDLLFTFNIALALMVVMISAHMVKPLDFAAFPAVLLITTLMRLSLNVASTRVVLVEGHTGPGAAGKVIESFGHFVIGGNFAVGLIVFAILVVINFVVVTKGAERIAEVGARFRASRWRSTPSSTPAPSTRPKRGAAAPRWPKKPTSLAAWTAPASSCAATRWPAC